MAGLFTFVFCEVEGSVGLVEELGAVRFGRVLGECWRAVGGVFREFGGVEVDKEGDPSFVAFDSALAALDAVSEVLLVLAASRDSDVAGLRLKFGVHLGEAISVSGGFVGLSINRVARISAVAHGGQVVVSEETVRRVEVENPGRLEFVDLGRHRLKDLSEPQRLFQLVVSGVENEFGPLLSLEAYPTNLPAQLTPFVGRVSDVARVSALVCDGEARVVSLVGAGGVGKTRLALQAAAGVVELFPDGVFFIGLAPLRDSASVLGAIAEVVGVHTLGAESVDAALSRFLAGKHTLLVVDNFEHLSGAAGIVGGLVDRCDLLRILATSRQRLGTSSEVVFTVEPLAAPGNDVVLDVDEVRRFDSVSLFIDRGRAVQPRFAVDSGNVATVAGICRLLDGVPLAIELAAARLKLFSPQAILDRLSEQFSLLTTGARDAPDRHRSMNLTIGWSYDLLPNNEQVLFARLAIFNGGCTPEAAKSICDASSDVALSLVSKSLLRYVDGRFSMLQTIREFAQAKLDQIDPNRVIQKQHAQWYADFVEQAQPHLRDGQADWLSLVDADINNIRAAIETLGRLGENEARLAITTHLFGYWMTNGLTIEAREQIEPAFAACGDIDHMLRHDTLNALTFLAYRQGRIKDALELGEEDLNLVRKLNYLPQLAQALRVLAAVVHGAGNLVRAEALSRESLKISEKMRDDTSIARSLSHLANILIGQSRLDEAYEYCLRTLDVAHRQGLAGLEAETLTQLAEVDLERKRQNLATKWILNGFQVVKGLHDDYMVAFFLVLSAEVFLEHGEYIAGTKVLGAAEVLRKKTGSVVGPGSRQPQTAGRLKAVLSQETFKESWNQGTKLDATAATEYAIRLLKADQ